MTWFEILRIRAVRRKFLWNFLMIFLTAAIVGAESWATVLTGAVGRGAVLAVAILFAVAVVLQTVFPPYWIIRPFQGRHVSRRELSPDMWDAARRLSAKLRIEPPELYEFRGIGQGAVGWDFVLSRGVAIELAITRSKGLPRCLRASWRTNWRTTRIATGG